MKATRDASRFNRHGRPISGLRLPAVRQSSPTSGLQTSLRLPRQDQTMTKFLISFPAPAMDVPQEDWAEVGEAARAVIREAKHAGTYVFGGGINDGVAPVMVAADGTVTNDTYPQ